MMNKGSKIYHKKSGMRWLRLKDFMTENKGFIKVYILGAFFGVFIGFILMSVIAYHEIWCGITNAPRAYNIKYYIIFCMMFAAISMGFISLIDKLLLVQAKKIDEALTEMDNKIEEYNKRNESRWRKFIEKK